MASNDEKIQALNERIEASKKSLELVTSSKESQATQGHGGWWSVNEAMTISASVLIFGLILSLVVGYLLAKGKSPDLLLRTFGTILIIISAVFLVVAGYSDKQIAPVMGLLGTIAGYLLGKSNSDNQPKA